MPYKKKKLYPVLLNNRILHLRNKCAQNNTAVKLHMHLLLISKSTSPASVIAGFNQFVGDNAIIMYVPYMERGPSRHGHYCMLYGEKNDARQNKRTRKSYKK